MVGPLGAMSHLRVPMGGSSSKSSIGGLGAIAGAHQPPSPDRAPAGLLAAPGVGMANKALGRALAPQHRSAPDGSGRRSISPGWESGQQRPGLGAAWVGVAPGGSPLPGPRFGRWRRAWAASKPFADRLDAIRHVQERWQSAIWLQGGHLIRGLP